MEVSARRHHANTFHGSSSINQSTGTPSAHSRNLLASQLNPTLCNLCQNLSVKKLSARQEVWDDNGEITEEYGCSHHKSFSALKDSADSCALCKLFVQSIGQDNGGFLGGIIEAPHLTDDELSSPQTEIRLLGLEFPFDQSVPPGLSHLSVGHNKRSGVLALYSEADDPAAKYGDVTGRKVGDHPGSKQSLNLVKCWLHDCLEKHRECSELFTEDRPLPTRVIDVGGNEKEEAPILVETNGHSGQYITLSHRWAKASEMVKLESTNLEAFKKGLVYESLPKVFRDAILVTRLLGVRYIWIDSICILQDSLEDWKREAARMGFVYSNSILTIAATGADDSNEGCFLPRNAPETQPVMLNYPIDSASEVGRIFLTPRRATFDESVSRGPLSRRGWVLQELILSRRVLHYAREQMYWECQSVSKAEDGGTFKAHSRFKQLLSSHDPPGFSYTRPLQDRWYRLVEDYKSRLLTKDTDMLPALSGIASEFGKHVQQKYLAGLWNLELANGLLWHARDSYLKQPSTYRAPSWSWAALNGPITYNLSSNLSNRKIVSAIDEQSIAVNIKSAHPFGSVEAGSLNLSGWIKKSTHSHTAVDRSETIMHEQDFSGPDLPSYTHFTTKSLTFCLHHLMDDTGEVIGWTVFDEADAVVKQEKFTCLRVSDNHNPQYKDRTVTYNILVLRPTKKKPNEYRRVGMGEIRQSDWFDGMRENISII